MSCVVESDGRGGGGGETTEKVEFTKVLDKSLNERRLSKLVCARCAREEAHVSSLPYSSLSPLHLLLYKKISVCN